MQHIDKIKAEAEQIQLIKQTEGFRVIMSELTRRIENVGAIDISDPEWVQKMTYREGKLQSLADFEVWLTGRMNLDPDSLPDSPPEA